MIFAGRRPKNLGVHNGRLAPCPNKPNCVSSQAVRRIQTVEPLTINDSYDKAMAKIEAAINGLKGAEIVTSKPGYFHVECKSSILGFIDDLEILWDESEHMFHIRSASRLGYSDMGVNKKRVEKLRKSLSKS